MTASPAAITPQSRAYWDTVKGLGAIAIVLGHSCYPIADFLYLFHLALFFFVSGYLYSENKYGDRLSAFVFGRLRSTWPRYVGCCAVLILLHNLFLDASILLSEPRYGFFDVVYHLTDSFLLSCSQTMGGALWFVPVLLFASSLFAGVVSLSRAFSRRFSASPAVIKHLSIALLSFAAGALGVVLNLRGESLPLHLHTAYLVVPLFAAAYFLRTFCADLRPLLKGVVALPLAIGLSLISHYGWRVDLAAERIIGPMRFYLVSLAGVYICLYAAKWLSLLPGIRRLLALLGRRSFAIMAFHFVAIKLVDLAYAALIGETDPAVYGVFVCAYSYACWPFYALLGTLLPALAAEGASRLLDAARRRF